MSQREMALISLERSGLDRAAAELALEQARVQWQRKRGAVGNLIVRSLGQPGGKAVLVWLDELLRVELTDVDESGVPFSASHGTQT